MSNAPDSNFDLDLHFLPAWAQQSPDVNRFANFEGETEGRGDRPRFGRGPRRDNRDRRPRRDQSPEGRGGPNRFEGPRRDDGRGGGRRRPDERREPPVVLPEVEVAIIPEEKGVEALARQIKLTGRAYPLFDIGFLILKKPERYNVRFNIVKKADGTVAQPLFLCSLDETVWLSEQEAMNYVLDRHFDTFYRSDKIPAEPPKGVFTFVAQCGMSGIVLGPPNYHDYQNKLRKLHAERYAHLPFEVYKSRVKIVRDEAVVKKWLEDQSFSTEYVCLNVTESLKLGSREEVEKHFLATHLANVIQPIETLTLTGVAARSQTCHPIQALARRAWEEQRRFPLKVVTTLSQMFAAQGLQFFKVNKTLTHVAVSRPHFLDLNVTPVSEGIKKIIGFINANPGCNRRRLVLGLVPNAQAAAGDSAAPSGTSAGAVASGQNGESLENSPEASAVIGDLHWLIHQGHVIEFANGGLETAKQPPPRPPKPAAKPAPAEAQASVVEETPSGPAQTEGAAVEATPSAPATPAMELGEAEAVAAAPTVTETSAPEAQNPEAPVNAVDEPVADVATQEPATSPS